MNRSYKCPECKDHYPYEDEFKVCPLCEMATKATYSAPDVSADEAEARYERAERWRAFQAWCLENAREELERPPYLIRMRRGSTYAQRMEAHAIVEALEWEYPQYAVGVLHVL